MDAFLMVSAKKASLTICLGDIVWVAVKEFN